MVGDYPTMFILQFLPRLRHSHCSVGGTSLATFENCGYIASMDIHGLGSLTSSHGYANVERLCDARSLNVCSWVQVAYTISQAIRFVNPLGQALSRSYVLFKEVRMGHSAIITQSPNLITLAKSIKTGSS